MEYIKEEDVCAEIVLLQKVEKLKELLKIKEPTTDELNQIKKLKDEGIDPNYKKTKFGEMCLLLIKRILTLPKFSGYTYKDDFISNAVEKLMSYGVKNFDAEKVSKITGKKVKAFAYLTQIIMNAIIQVINERKAENESLESYHKENTFEVKNETIYTDDEELNKFDIVISCTSKINDTLYKLIGKNKREEYFGGDNKYIINGEEKDFISIYDILKDINPKLKVRLIYPTSYKFSYEEYDKIKELGFGTLDIVKYEYCYVPQMTKKQKVVKENELNLWA